jgi:hypothetical protein
MIPCTNSLTVKKELIVLFIEDILEQIKVNVFLIKFTHSL